MKYLIAIVSYSQGTMELIHNLELNATEPKFSNARSISSEDLDRFIYAYDLLDLFYNPISGMPISSPGSYRVLECHRIGLKALDVEQLAHRLADASALLKVELQRFYEWLQYWIGYSLDNYENPYFKVTIR